MQVTRGAEDPLRLVALGWGVVPLHTPTDGRCSCGDATCGHPGKHPRLAEGELAPLWDAHPTREAVSAWWQRWPDANIGVLTGKLAGLVVLDIDPRHGGEASLEELIEKHGALPDGPVCITGSGGQHYYYQWPSELDLRSRPILPGIDIKAARGYVVAPPSMHASGRPYTWEASAEPWDTTIPPCPAHIIQSFQVVSALSSSIYVVDDEPFDIQRVMLMSIPSGLRNLALTQIAGHFYGKGEALESVLQQLHGVNARLCDPKLSDKEVRGIAESVHRTHLRSEQRRTRALRLAIPDADIKSLTPKDRIDHVDALLAMAVLDVPSVADWSLSQGANPEYTLRFRDGRSVSLGPRIGDQTTIRHRLLDGGPLILKPVKAPEWLRWAAAMRSLVRIEQFEPTDAREIVEDWLSHWTEIQPVIDEPEPDELRSALNQSIVRINGRLWLRPQQLHGRLFHNGYRKLDISDVYKRLTQAGWRRGSLMVEGSTTSGRTSVGAWREG